MPDDFLDELIERQAEQYRKERGKLRKRQERQMARQLRREHRKSGRAFRWWFFKVRVAVFVDRVTGKQWPDVGELGRSMVKIRRERRHEQQAENRAEKIAMLAILIGSWLYFLTKHRLW